MWQTEQSSTLQALSESIHQSRRHSGGFSITAIGPNFEAV